MSILPYEIRSQLPPLYSQEHIEDPIAHVKFFLPGTAWIWYATEFDGRDRCFGLVRGQEEELGYFSLSELESLPDRHGECRVERDLFFEPTPLSQLREYS
jgi:Protein of unknown function (DUF2958)